SFSEKWYPLFGIMLWQANVPSSPDNARNRPTTGEPPPRREAVVVCRCGAGICDFDRGWSDPAHRIRPFDRGVEAGDRRRAAARGFGLAGRVREIPNYSAIPRAQCRHDPRSVQGDLLVGVVAPDV